MRARVLILLLFFPLLAQAQLYRWVDDKGNVHFSDRAPVSGAKDLHKTPMPAAQGSSAALPYALQQAVTNFPVTLYTSEICKESCAQAREFLNKRGVPYREITVKDEADIAQLKKLSGDSVVPVMTVGQEVYKGFEREIYKTALDVAEYPANSILPPGVQAQQRVTKPVQKPAAAGTDGTPETPAREPAETAAPK